MAASETRSRTGGRRLKLATFADYGAALGSHGLKDEDTTKMTDVNAEIKAEIEALETVMSALARLEDVTRRRVLGYVQQRFGLTGAELAPRTQSSLPSRQVVPEPAVSEAASTTGEIRDIRTLKEIKEPKSAIEMAVLVAYYLSEIARPPEKKSTIGTADMTKYFKHADYRLPSEPRVILHQAKNGGYLDSATRGQYSLNPVGYNLVAHGLPREAAGGSGQGKPRANEQTKGGARRRFGPKRRVAAARTKQSRNKR